MIILVACTEINLGIGDAEGNLLFDLPRDMSRFKSITSGKHVVMGRKTWDSLPNKPLPKRKNYVLTHDESFEVKGKTQVLHSIEEVIELGKKKDIYVIGGGEIYKQLIDHADKLIMTHVHTVDLRARVFFPDFDTDQWKITESKKQEADEKHKHSFTFATYKRIATKEEAEKKKVEEAKVLLEENKNTEE